MQQSLKNHSTIVQQLFNNPSTIV